MPENSKDYVINLRVSRATYDKIRQKARENRESISSLVRKAIDDSAEIITDLTGEIFGNQNNKFRDVIGYHKSKAAKDLKCAKCGMTIPAGEVATAGETEGPSKYVFCENSK